MIRGLDIVLSIIGLLVCLPVILLLIIAGLFDTGSPLFFQKRIGKEKKVFTLVKFRTMALDTPSVPSHLADKNTVTKFGRFLRNYKLDEIPQLWNVLKGDMSFVGPRPCLNSQKELIEAREIRGVFKVKPGITGLSQINEIDMSTPLLLAQIDQEMILNFGIVHYFKFIFLTLLGKGRGDRIKK